MGKKKEKDELDYEPVTAKDDLKLKRRGKPVDVVSPAPESRRMVYFGLRLDRDTLKAIEAIAEREAVGPTVIARRILQEGVRQDSQLPHGMRAWLVFDEAIEIIEKIRSEGHVPTPDNTLSEPQAIEFLGEGVGFVFEGGASLGCNDAAV